ncbi:MAG: hypothetical protein ACRC1Z_24065 [Waterburya sp.]
MMNYLVAEQNTLIWFCFTVYVVTAVFLFPSNIEPSSQSADVSEQKIWQFASRFILRIVLIVPMVFLLKNNL